MIPDVQLLTGNALEVLRGLPDESVNCCVTSPPYWGLRDYGGELQVWGGDPDHPHEWEEAPFIHSPGRDWDPTAEVSPVSRKGQKARRQIPHGDRDSSPYAGARVEVDSTEVVPVGYFCKCGAWRGQLGLEPTPQLFVRNLVLIFDEVFRVLRKDGTCWIVIGDSYATGGGKAGVSPGGSEQGERWNAGRGANPSTSKRGTNVGPAIQPNRLPIPGLKAKDLCGVPWRLAFALQDAGWYLRSDVIWSKPNPMPESVLDRPTKAHEYVFLFVKNEGRAHRSHRRGLVNLAKKLHGGRDTRNSRRTGKASSASPGSLSIEELPRRCLLAGCPPRGTVLDPFAGSGTSIAIGVELGLNGIAIDQNAEYIELARKRISGKNPPLAFEEVL